MIILYNLYNTLNLSKICFLMRRMLWRSTLSAQYIGRKPMKEKVKIIKYEKLYNVYDCTGNI